MNNIHYIGKNAKSFILGSKMPPVTGIELSGDADRFFVAGTDEGYVLKTYVPTASQKMANDMLERIKGFEYQGYAAKTAYLDPAAELGDIVKIMDTYSILANREFSFTPKLTEDISAPYETTEDHEYEYTGSYQKELDNKVTLNNFYYGVSITRKSGIEIVKTDDETIKSRAILNSDELKFYNDNGQEAFYFDSTEGVFRLTQYADVEGALSGSQAFSQLELTASQLSLKIQDAERNISSLTLTATQLASEIKDAKGNISSLQQTATSFQSQLTSMSGSISSITQKINSISLSVSGSLGNSASIQLTVDGKTTGGSVDMSNVRSAFANDNSAVTISGGTVTFNTGTFILNGGNVSIDSKGNLTTQGAMVTQSTFESNSGGIKTRIENGLMKIYRNNVLFGQIGTNNWPAANANGIVFDLDYQGDYIAWCAKSSASASLYTIQLAYINKPLTSGTSQYSNWGLYFLSNVYASQGITFGGTIGTEAGWIGNSSTAYNGTLMVESFRDLILRSDVTKDGYRELQTGTIRVQAKVFDFGNATTTSNSDVRLKTNIVEENADALSLLNRIKLYSFDWIASGIHKELGFIAQQIEAEVGGMFTYYDTDTDKHQILDTAMIPYIVKAIQQLYCMIVPQDTSGKAKVSRIPWSPNLYTEEEKLAFVHAEYERIHMRPEIPEPEYVTLGG